MVTCLNKGKAAIGSMEKPGIKLGIKLGNSAVGSKKDADVVVMGNEKKVTVAEAAGKIMVDDLEKFLNLLDEYLLLCYENKVYSQAQHAIQLMQFADYIDKAFSAVSASEFPWIKLFRESNIAEIVDVPVRYISEDVYSKSVDWITRQPLADLGTFIIWGLDSILVDLASINCANTSLQSSSKSKVAIFVVVAMVLWRKPDALIAKLPLLKNAVKYKGEDQLLLIIWLISQACYGDICIGLYAWALNLLPMISMKSCNHQSGHLILQLVERILSGPKADTILRNKVFIKGERVLPPMAFDLLMRATFSSSEDKATERLKTIYPTLKEVALAGSARSKAMKRVSQEILTFAVKAAGEGNPRLSKEAINVFAWCLAKNPDCYRQWGKIYKESIEVSLAVLIRINMGLQEFFANQSSADALTDALKSFKDQNAKSLATTEDRARRLLFKEADRTCRIISSRIIDHSRCAKFLSTVVSLVIAIATFLYLGPLMQKLSSGELSKIDLEKLLKG